MRPDYPRETARLLLRPFEERDLDDAFSYWSLPEACTYLYSSPCDRAGERLAEQIGRHKLTEEGRSSGSASRTSASSG